jgi:hypothetical protein
VAYLEQADILVNRALVEKVVYQVSQVLAAQAAKVVIQEHQDLVVYQVAVD